MEPCTRDHVCYFLHAQLCHHLLPPDLKTACRMRASKIIKVYCFAILAALHPAGHLCLQSVV